MGKEINSFSVEENGIRQINKTYDDGTTVSTMILISTGEKVLETISSMGGATEIQYIVRDFWDITIDGNKVSADDLQSMRGGPMSLLVLMNDRTTQIKTK